ncbi:hypothetical protein HDU88_007373 [Geranomyces variabilis]|nr:hypothetical protein HDU88_007373 [Geranomyces variabilis]
MRGPDGRFYFDRKCRPRDAEFPPPSEPPHPYNPSADCKCYACAWRCLAEQNPYPAFPDLEDKEFLIRCSSGVLFDNRPTDHNHTDDDHSSVHQWVRNPDKLRRALKRYLKNPYPPLYLEAQASVRPVQFISTGRDIWEAEARTLHSPGGIMQTIPQKLSDCYDPLLVDCMTRALSDADGDPNIDLLSTENFIDFDLIDASGTDYAFRMQVNWGEPGFGLGWHATIRDRSSAKLVGNIVSVHENETLFSCFDDQLLTKFVEHEDLPSASLLIPFIRGPPTYIYNEEDEHDNGEIPPDLVLDTYRDLINPYCDRSSRGHQIELMFAIAARINEGSFTIFKVPHAVATDFKFALIKKAVGNRFLLPDELLRMIAGWDPAILHWRHVPSAPRRWP